MIIKLNCVLTKNYQNSYLIWMQIIFREQSLFLIILLLTIFFMFGYSSILNLCSNCFPFSCLKALPIQFKNMMLMYRLIINKYILDQVKYIKLTPFILMKIPYERDFLNPLNRKYSDVYAQATNQLLKKPYNINISFNINPKSILNQQIHKLYSIKQQCYDQFLQNKTHKKIGNTSKFDCYRQNQNSAKANAYKKNIHNLNSNCKNAKRKHQDKSKNSQIALKEKFQKLNKMKKCLLQKIGSLEIYLQNKNQGIYNQHQFRNDKVDKYKNYQNMEQQLVQSKHLSNLYKFDRKNQQGENLITQKLQQYSPDELISFQNQKSQKEDYLNQDISATFPMIFQNSLSIKREYQKNYNKNFKDESQHLDIKKLNKKNKKQHQKHPLSARLFNNQEEFKSKSKKQNLSNRIRIMHQKMLQSQSLKNIYKSTEIKQSKQEQVKKKLIIKTQDELEQIKGQISYYSKQRPIKTVQQQNIYDCQNSLSRGKGQNQSLCPTDKIIDYYVQMMSQSVGIYKLQKKTQNQNLQKAQGQKNDFIVDAHYQQREVDKSKQLSESLSNKQQPDELSFTFALKQSQFQQQPDIYKRNSYQNLQYSEEFLRNINNKCINDQIQGVLPLSQFQYFQKLKQKNLQNKSIDINQSEIDHLKFEAQKVQPFNYKQKTQQRQDSEVDSFVYGKDDNQGKLNMSQSSQSIDDENENFSKRLSKITLQKQMKQELSIRLAQLKRQKQSQKVKQTQNIFALNQSENIQSEKLQNLMKFIKVQLQRQEQTRQQNVFQVICQQISTICQTIQGKMHVSLNQQFMPQLQKNQLLEHIQDNLQTPLKNKDTNSYKKIKHNRNFSTQNRKTNDLTNSNDLTLWDLRILQISLNKKYRDLSFRKQKIFEQIVADQTLDDQDYTKKIKMLKIWERQNKQQIIETKIKTSQNIRNYLRIVNADSNSTQKQPISKSFSNQNLKFSKNVQNSYAREKINLLRQYQYLKHQNKGHLAFKDQDRFYCKANQTSHYNEKYQTDVQFQQFKKLKELHIHAFRQNQCISSANSLINANQYDFEQNQQDYLPQQDNYDIQPQQQITNLRRTKQQIQKDQFSALMNRPLFKLNQINNQKFYLVQDGEDVQSNHFIEEQLFKQKISEQQKIDIFQFIFLDLCIELYQQTIDFQEKQIFKGKLNEGSHRILNAIWNYIKNQKKLFKNNKKKSPKIGIYTGLNTVKQYLQKISIFSINYSERITNKNILEILNQPLGPTASDLLKSMRFNTQYDYQEEKTGDFQNEALNSLVLPIYTFTDFQAKIQNQKQFKFQNYFQDQEKQKNRLIFLKNMTHVHHKAVFDALNQMLDYQRPFGIWGKPFPWKKCCQQKIKNSNDIRISLDKSCSKVSECAMYMCGLLVDKQESLVKDANISAAYLEEVKEDRMSKLIINDFIQNQVRWFFLDDQQTQVLLQISYIVWIVMLQQSIKQLRAIFLGRNNI